MSQKGISSILRKKILKRDGYICQKCGFEGESLSDLEIHHINPHFKGGDDSPSNLITLCFDCHRCAPNSKEQFK